MSYENTKIRVAVVQKDALKHSYSQSSQKTAKVTSQAYALYSFSFYSITDKLKTTFTVLAAVKSSAN